MTKPLVYLAGPITAAPLDAPRQALAAFQPLRDLGLVPFLPQLTVLAELIDPQPYETWMAYDLEVIDHCAALIRLPGESPGADREVAHARDVGIPVFGWPDDLAVLAGWAGRPEIAVL